MSQRAPASSKRPSGSSKLLFRRLPGVDLGSFLAFFWELHSLSFVDAVPERRLPGSGGQSPQASSIRRPLAGVSNGVQLSSDSVRCMHFAQQDPPRPYRVTSTGWHTVDPRWTHGGSTFCRPAVPNAVLELPGHFPDAPETLPRRPPLSRWLFRRNFHALRDDFRVKTEPKSSPNGAPI